MFKLRRFIIEYGSEKNFQSGPETLVRCKTKEEINKKNFIIFLFPLLFFVKHKCPYMIKWYFNQKIWKSYFSYIFWLVYIYPFRWQNLFLKKKLSKYSYKSFVKLKLILGVPTWYSHHFVKIWYFQVFRALLRKWSIRLCLYNVLGQFRVKYMLSRPLLWALWCPDMMSLHDIDVAIVMLGHFTKGSPEAAKKSNVLRGTF